MTAATVGLVGAGGIAHAHLPGWLGLGHRVVVFSIDGQAPSLTAKFGGEAVGSIAELLARADIVDVCTPTSTHRELVEQAAAAGKHVICEKPLALTVEDCQAMIEACERAGVRLFPAHVVRYFSAYETAHRAAIEGELGDLAVQRFSRIGALPGQPWFFDADLSGGIAVDQMIHDFDFARWVAGPVDTVYATRSGESAPGRATTVQAVLRHSSGVITHVNGAWGAPSLTFRTTYQLAGTGGIVEHDSLEHPVLSIDGPGDGGSGYLPPIMAAASPYTTELDDFVRAIRSGTPARVSAEDGLEAVRIATAVNRSIDENRQVSVAAAESATSGIEEAR